MGPTASFHRKHPALAWSHVVFHVLAMPALSFGLVEDHNLRKSWTCLTGPDTHGSHFKPSRHSKVVTEHGW